MFFASRLERLYFASRRRASSEGTKAFQCSKEFSQVHLYSQIEAAGTIYIGVGHRSPVLQ